MSTSYPKIDDGFVYVSDDEENTPRFVQPSKPRYGYNHCQGRSFVEKNEIKWEDDLSFYPHRRAYFEPFSPMDQNLKFSQSPRRMPQEYSHSPRQIPLAGEYSYTRSYTSSRTPREAREFDYSRHNTVSPVSVERDDTPEFYDCSLDVKQLNSEPLARLKERRERILRETALNEVKQTPPLEDPFQGNRELLMDFRQWAENACSISTETKSTQTFEMKRKEVRKELAKKTRAEIANLTRSARKLVLEPDQEPNRHSKLPRRRRMHKRTPSPRSAFEGRTRREAQIAHDKLSKERAAAANNKSGSKQKVIQKVYESLVYKFKGCRQFKTTDVELCPLTVRIPVKKVCEFDTCEKAVDEVFASLKQGLVDFSLFYLRKKSNSYRGIVMYMKFQTKDFCEKAQEILTKHDQRHQVTLLDEDEA